MSLWLGRLVNMGVLLQASAVMMDNLLTLCFSQLLFEWNRSTLQRYLRVKLLTSSCCGDEGSVSAPIKIVNVLGLQFIQQLMRSYISLHISRVELFNAVAHYYNILLIKISFLSLKWNSPCKFVLCVLSSAVKHYL